MASGVTDSDQHSRKARLYGVGNGLIAEKRRHANHAPNPRQNQRKGVQLG